MASFGDEEMRASTLIPTVHSTLESFREFLPQLYTGADLEAERAQAMVYIGSLQSMRESIEVLINRHLDDGDDEKLLLLLDMHDQVAAILGRDDLQTLQEGAGEGGGRRGGERKDESEEEEAEAAALAAALRESAGDARAAAAALAATEEVVERKQEEPEAFAEVLVESGRKWRVEADFECPICIDEIPKEEGFAFECTHAYCRECLEMYLRTTIESGNVIDIVCPDPTCQIPVLVTDIVELVDNNLFNKYQNLSLLQCLKADPHAKWCPWPDCDEIMIYDGDDQERERLTCQRCFRAICSGCFQKYHVESCAELAKNHEPDDKKTAKWKKRHGIKPCPHCGVATQKISGCPDMRCVNCKRSWEWYHDEEQWNSSGLTKKDESMIEKAAFVYPRLFKQALGSREVAANEDKKEILITVGLVGVAGVPVTIISMPPALTIKAGKSLKRKLSRVSKRIKGEKEETPAA